MKNRPRTNNYYITFNIPDSCLLVVQTNYYYYAIKEMKVLKLDIITLIKS